jgi:hypothetical protein
MEIGNWKREKRRPRRTVRDGQKAPASEGGCYKRKEMRESQIVLRRLEGAAYTAEEESAGLPGLTV